MQAHAVEEFALEGVWRAKQEAEPGTPLPSDFPYLTRLAQSGYTTVHDLDGADVEEMLEAGFNEKEALAIGEALEPFQPV